MSVRFLGPRVYLGLIVVLMSVRRTTLSASAVQAMPVNVKLVVACEA